MLLEIALLGSGIFTIWFRAFERPFFCVGPGMTHEILVVGRSKRTGFKLANEWFLTAMKSGVRNEPVSIVCGIFAVGLRTGKFGFLVRVSFRVFS